MDIRLSVIICVVALAVWIGVSIAERKLREKRAAEAERQRMEDQKRFTGVYYGGGNDQGSHFRPDEFRR